MPTGSLPSPWPLMPCPSLITCCSCALPKHPQPQPSQSLASPKIPLLSPPSPPSLQVCCQQHGISTHIRDPSDFNDLVGDGGCQRQCGRPLPRCSHPCPRRCHADDPTHETVKSVHVRGGGAWPPEKACKVPVLHIMHLVGCMRGWAHQHEGAHTS